MKTVFVLILAFPFSFLSAHVVKIEAEFENAKDSTIISFNKSVDLDNKNYWMDSHKTVIMDNKFVKEFDFEKSGTLTINYSIYTPRIELIVDKDSYVKIILKKNKELIDVAFEGDNALGLEELNSSALFKYRTLEPIADTFFKESNSSDIFIDKVNKFQLKTLEKFDSLFCNKKISESFYRIVQKEAELQLINIINQKALNFKDNLNLRNQFNLSNEELDKIIVVFNKKYDVFDIGYEECNGLHRIVAIEGKCSAISKGVIHGLINNIDLWNGYQAYLNFAPSNYQELIMATNINSMGFEKSGCSFEKFKKTFPNSPYLSVLEMLQKSFKSSNIVPYTLLNYSVKSGNMKIIGTEMFNGIKELIDKKFPNRPVFVDLWATYCAPCKVEFSYSKELHDFLDTKNIVMLYVSVDSKEFTQKWENDIYQFKLDGNHYFASDGLLKSMQKLVNEETIAIPRYLLFNAKGELVLKNTEKPSQGQRLYNQIAKALN